MSDKGKIMGALVLGAIAGAAIVKLLETEKGKEFVANAKEKAEAATEDIKLKLKQLESELADLLKTDKTNNANNEA
jgi:gas vesicle protein